MEERWKRGGREVEERGEGGRDLRDCNLIASNVHLTTQILS